VWSGPKVGRTTTRENDAVKKEIRRWKILLCVGALLWCAAAAADATAQIVITANDGNARVADGQIKVIADGPNTISILDTTTMPPRITTVEGVVNSLYGPPTNIGVTPDERLALVSEAMRVGEKEGKPAFVKSNIVHVIDLKADPPQEIGTVEVGLQPSGIAVSPDGRVALVCNRAANSISVLRIDGMTVQNVGTVDMGDSVTDAAFTPDGRSALANKFTKGSVALLTVDGTEVSYTGQDIPVGLYPYCLSISPDGTLALVPNMGAPGRSDGHLDSVTVIDLTATPPRVIDYVTVGDAPEGIDISPDGTLAATAELAGTDAPPDAWFRRERSTTTILKIEGKRVTNVGQLPTGPIGESISFTPDGRYLLIANFMGDNVSVFKVEDGTVTPAGFDFPVGMGPAAMSKATPYGR